MTRLQAICHSETVNTKEAKRNDTPAQHRRVKGAKLSGKPCITSPDTFMSSFEFFDAITRGRKGACPSFHDGKASF